MLERTDPVLPSFLVKKKNKKELDTCMNYLLLMKVDGRLAACKEEFRHPS